MKNHFDISGSIKIREVDIAGVACITLDCFFCQCFFTQCIGYNMSCIGVVTKSNQMAFLLHLFKLSLIQESYFPSVCL